MTGTSAGRRDPSPQGVSPRSGSGSGSAHGHAPSGSLSSTYNQSQQRHSQSPSGFLDSQQLQQQQHQSGSAPFQQPPDHSHSHSLGQSSQGFSPPSASYDQLQYLSQQQQQQQAHPLSAFASLYAQQQPQSQSQLQQQSATASASGSAFGSGSGSGSMRPSSLSLLTNTGDSAFAMLVAGSGSPSASAMLASLDPTSTVYDENSGGYGTPSYAGSYADDSSFEDRDLTLDFGSFTNFPLSDYDQQQQQQQQHQQQHQPQAQDQQSQPAPSPGQQQQPVQPLASPPQQPQQHQQGGQSPFASAFSHYQQPQGLGQYSQSQGQPVFGKTGADLYAFRDANRPPAANEWDSNSSIGGASGASPAHTGNLHSSPEMGAYQSSFSSSSFGGSGQGGPVQVQEGNGLEMAVERMFAPFPSPQVLGATPSPPVPPVRDDTIRSSSVPLLDPRDDPAAPLFTASPNHSPRLEAQGAEGSAGPHLASTTSLPNVPTLSRLSPSPASPSFRNTHVHAAPNTQGPPHHPQPLRQLAHDVQPSLRSPPLPNGVAHSLVSDQARLVQLAPLAIPERPDLTLTTATPTAMPRTAITARQDSTQAALDTVFSTFFDRANRANRTVSAESHQPAEPLTDFASVSFSLAYRTRRTACLQLPCRQKRRKLSTTFPHRI